MKGIVIYTSNTGYAEKYANMISEKLGFELYPLKAIGKKDLSQYDHFVYGGSVLAGTVRGLDKFLKRSSDIKAQNFVVFAVGMAAINEDIINKTTSESLNSVSATLKKVFYLRGGMDVSRLGFVEKGIMKMIKKSIEKKPSEDWTQDDKDMMDGLNKGVDFVSEKAIDSLVQYIKDGK